MVDKKKLVAGGIALAGVSALLLALKGRAAPPPPGMSSLGGIISDVDTGTPVIGVQVTLDGKITSTNNDGYYYLNNITPGPYALYFIKSGYQEADMQITLVEGQNTVDLQMTKIVIETYLEGTVAEDTTPLAGVKITIDGQTAYSDAIGYFILHNLTPGVPLTLTWELAGYVMA